LFAIVVSPFLVDALLVSPETEKAQPIWLTDWAGLWFVAAMNTACFMPLCGEAHLLSSNEMGRSRQETMWTTGARKIILAWFQCLSAEN
jgi:hypothetical protein